MDIKQALTFHGYDDAFVLLKPEAVDLCRCILGLGAAGDISSGQLVPLLVHVFAVAHPDGDDRDHHRGAMMFLLHEGGFTSATLASGEEMSAAPGMPEWVFDERFTALVLGMQEALEADISVAPDAEGVRIIVHARSEIAATPGYAADAIGYEGDIRATIAAIIGRDPGRVPVIVSRRSPDPLADMGVFAAQEPPAPTPLDKVILPTGQLRYDDVVALHRADPTDITPMKPFANELFRVKWLSVEEGENGHLETLTLTSATGHGQYHRDFTGYEWEVVERKTPQEVLKAANEIEGEERRAREAAAAGPDPVRAAFAAVKDAKAAREAAAKEAGF